MIRNLAQLRFRFTHTTPNFLFGNENHYFAQTCQRLAILPGSTINKGATPSTLSPAFTFGKAYFSSFTNFWKRMGDMQSQEIQGLADTTEEERPGKIVLTDEQWRAKLTPEQYSVCRRHGTERAWTGDLLDNKRKGVYVCACCGVDIFSSSTKFDSGSGWPSFFDVLKDKDKSELPAVNIKRDSSHGMVRTEVLCGKCDAHLGHVFNDGPRPTGLRYCINSVCLKFRPDKETRSDL